MGWQQRILIDGSVDSVNHYHGRKKIALQEYRPLTSHVDLYGEFVLSYLVKCENFGDFNDSYAVSHTDYLGIQRTVR